MKPLRVVIYLALALALLCVANLALAQENNESYLAFSRFMPGRTNTPTAVTPNLYSPGWTPIETEGQPLDYKMYGAVNSATATHNCVANYNCELLGMTADNAYTFSPWGTERIRPPATTYFVTQYQIGNSTSYGGCGNNLVPASMFTVATPFSGAKGIVWEGYLGGGDGAYTTASGYYSIAAMYVSSNECAAGDQEYGFFADTTKSSNGEISGQYWIFYYSTATNTPQQQTSKPANSAVIGNLTGTGMMYFSMYIIPAHLSPTVPTSDTGWDFRIQVLNTDYSFAQCKFGLAPNQTASQNCTIDIPISQMIYPNGSLAGQWPVNGNSAGTANGVMPGLSYATVATQTSAGSNQGGFVPDYTCQGCANGIWTNGVWLGF
jgi:hypothetical protein